MATTNLGRVVPLYLGDYSASATYELNHIVKYGKSFYWHYSPDATTGVAPTDTSVWRCLIESGAVDSVNGQTGEVQLTQDTVPAGSIYTRITPAQVQQIADNQTAIQLHAVTIFDNVVAISSINDKIPTQASSSNQLADKQFVNSSIQTSTAHYRGSWATWAAVPTDSSLYPQDDDGVTIPTSNDYLVIQDAKDYPIEASEAALVGTWRFKYGGLWTTNGKNGWHPEYQVNEEPLTAAQIAALNSGITAAGVAQIGANQTAISGIKNGASINNFAGVEAALVGKQSTLTFDQAPTAGSSNPVTSDGIVAALGAKQNTLTFDQTPTEGSSNPVTSDGVETALAGKQNTLTFDQTPIAGSSNPVTSDGVATALAGKAATASVPASMAISAAGVMTFSNASGTALFTGQLPIYDGTAVTA